LGTVTKEARKMRKKDHNTRKPLSPRQIAAIYCDRTRSQYQIAELYGISQSLVSLIRSGRRWARLTRDLPRYIRKDFRHERSGRRKLTQPQVKDIYSSHLSRQALMNAYGINRRTVERICCGESHRHLTQHLVRSTSRLVLK
jgi:predicted transcriptional regulator